METDESTTTAYATTTDKIAFASSNDENTCSQFKKDQKLLKKYYYNFPVINDDMKTSLAKAELFTEQLLSGLPSGDPADKSTLWHILTKLDGNEQRSCLFYDSSKDMRLYDTTGYLADNNREDRPIVLTLKSCCGLYNYTNDASDLEFIQLLNKHIENKYPHPIVDDILQRLSQAHRIDKSHVSIKHIVYGSINIVYTVSCLDANYLNQLPDRLKEQFDQFESVRVHPLLFRPSFDINFFDQCGDRSFYAGQHTFKIGPVGREKAYRQPIGWTRYGLKVLEKYGTDHTWLEPFRHAGNWYRAFHGTGRVQSEDFNGSIRYCDKDFAPVDAIASIMQNGFNRARVVRHGPGVYCSPNPALPEDRRYVRVVKISTQQGEKAFKCMLQVAVNPDGVLVSSNEDIWVVQNPQDIRVYGILIKEVNEANRPQCTIS
ncbi:unnamed protein product [Adineta ricciae]|nr:unnamed protein product [Adineta ricciae]